MRSLDRELYIGMMKNKITATSMKSLQNVLSKLTTTNIIDADATVAELLNIADIYLKEDSVRIISGNSNYELE